MKIKNLDDLMVSASAVKTELPEIMNKKQTRVIVKNNVPVSVVMPYDEYVTMNENVDEAKIRMAKMGQTFIMPNGVEVMVVAGIGSGISEDDLSIKMFHKMKSSDDYKLFHTFNISSPNIQSTMTIEEQIEYHKNRRNE